METVSQRNIGGKHRQGDGAAGYDDIPHPRRNGPSTDRMPIVRDPQRRVAAEDDPAQLDDLAEHGLPDDDELGGHPTEDDPGAGFGRGVVEHEWDEAWDDDGDDPGDDLADDSGDDRVGPEDRPAAEPEPVGESTRTIARSPVEPAAPAHQQPDIRRRRRRSAPARGVLRHAAWVAVGVAALVGVVLAAIVVFPRLTGGAPTEVPLSVAAPVAVAVESTFGERVVRDDGWTIEIDEPRAVRASDDVDLPATAERGLVFDVVLTNTGTEPRESAAWTVKATVGSTPVDLLPDGAAPSRTIRPGASLVFPVTVPMPEALSDLQLEAAPLAGPPSLFVGTV